MLNVASTMVMMRDTRINDIEKALSSQDGPSETVLVLLASFSADKLAIAAHDDEDGVSARSGRQPIPKW